MSLQTACSTLEPATMEEAAIITQLLYQLAGHVGYVPRRGDFFSAIKWDRFGLLRMVMTSTT